MQHSVFAKQLRKIFLLVLTVPLVVAATDFSSTNFTVKDPVVEGLSSFSTSTNFQVRGTIPYISSVRGTSTNFGVNPGFEAFGIGAPAIVMPILDALAGVAQVSLSWTAAQNVSGVTYEVGTATVSGGPYTYDSPQTTLTATVSGLTGGTTYYFIIRVKDGSAVTQGFSNEASATPTAPANNGGGGGGGGGGGQASATITLVPNQPPSTIIETITKIVNAIIPGFLKPKPKPPVVAETGVAHFVPYNPQLVFLNQWELIPPEPLREIVLRPLPVDIASLAGSIPQLSKLFSQVGITRFQDLEKLRSISLNVPGLTGALSLPTGVKTNPLSGAALTLNDLSPTLKSAIPTGILFSKVGNGKIDLNTQLTVNRLGQAEQAVTTITGKTLSPVIRPEGSPESVTGYLVFRSRLAPQYQQLPISRGFSLIRTAQAQTTPVQSTGALQTELVLQEFEYTDLDGDGLYTASIEAPQVSGNYEVITLIQYPGEAYPRIVRLITVVDPEGYVYENVDGKETRIGGAIVTLLRLNPATKKYETWNASEYAQENPQVTPTTGEYSFLVPEGFYQLSVVAPGYRTYEGKPFQVLQGTGVHENIAMQTNTWFIKVVDWRTVSLLLIGFLLLYNFYKDRRRERRERELILQRIGNNDAGAVSHEQSGIIQQL